MPSFNSRAIRLAIPNLSNAIDLFLLVILICQPDRSPFDPPLIVTSLKYPMDINTRNMNMVRIQLARLHQMFDFRDGNISCFGHRSGKITGGFSENQVSQRIPFPGFNYRKIGVKGMFHEIGLPIKFPYFFPLSYFSTITSRCKKGGNSHTGHLNSGSQGALGNEVHFQLTTQQMPFKLLIFAYVGADHFFYLAGFQEKTQATVVHPAIIADSGQLIDAAAG